MEFLCLATLQIPVSPVNMTEQMGACLAELEKHCTILHVMVFADGKRVSQFHGRGRPLRMPSQLKIEREEK